MDVVVPFDATDPKTRLAPLLTERERAAFATAMCRDVLGAVRAAGGDPTVLATAPVPFDAPITVDDRPLTAAVNAALDTAEGTTAVVMADLALATPAALARTFETDGDVVLVPGRGGGTNVVVAGDPAFRVDYHGGSIRDHRAIAREIGADFAEVDSYHLSTDIDEPPDLVEVLLHAGGEAADWLEAHGFAVTTTDGRVSVDRG